MLIGTEASSIENQYFTLDIIVQPRNVHIKGIRSDCD